MEGIEVRFDADREDEHKVIIDITSERVDFAGLVLTEQEAVELAQALTAASESARLARLFGGAHKEIPE